MREKLLYIEEVAERCRLPVSTMRWLRGQGRGPKSTKLGRRIVYRPSDVEAWIDEQFDTTDQVAG